MKNTAQFTIVFLLGLVVGLLLFNLIRLADIPPAIAATGPGEAGGLIAVTGNVSSGQDGLWVVNTMAGNSGPSICLYLPDNSGRGLRFAAARRIKYDIQLVELNDVTRPNEYRVTQLGREIEKLKSEGKEK